MRKEVLLSGLAMVCTLGFSQDSSLYKLNPWVDGAIIAAGIGSTMFALENEANEDRLTVAEINALCECDVPAFDRSALRIDPSKQKEILAVSDLGLNITAAAPVLLLLDKGVRSEWLNVGVLYIQAATVTAGMQTWTSSLTGRRRPIAYLENATLDQRIDARNRRSFYSGHTSNTAVASFFIAKVLHDMHPELGNKKWWLFGGAVLPPALVGWARIQGGKHFPSDVVVGAMVGGATGILVPELHKRMRGERFGFAPFGSPDAVGVVFNYTW